MKGRSPNFTNVPLQMVGSNKFGRYPKISIEETFNLIISDGFLVPFAGYQSLVTLLENDVGRAIYASTILNKLIVVIGNNVYLYSQNGNYTIVGTLNSYTGDVFVAENVTSQIAICDKQSIYIYNYSNNTFTTLSLDWIPGYISYQNDRFIAAQTGTSQWRLSAVGNGASWPNDAQHIGTFQTKPDQVIAAQRMPGRGNGLIVFGETVAEIWQDAGLQLFPYVRNSTVNIDYGCLNAATIAYNETILVWLGGNEKSGPVIMYTNGGDVQRISTDGIDFKFTQLTNPTNAFGFLFRQDGHLIYVLTFPDDQLTYIYDFNTKAFFTLTDENMNAFVALSIAFLNDKYYFVSYQDGKLYQIGTKFTTFNGAEIPRIRVCPTFRMPDTSRFSVPNLTFVIEEGIQSSTKIVDGDTILPAVDLSVSKNGGQSFGSSWRKVLNTTGNYRNRINYWQLGAANEFTPQFRFWGFGRYVVGDGLMSVYQ